MRAALAFPIRLAANLAGSIGDCAARYEVGRFAGSNNAEAGLTGGIRRIPEPGAEANLRSAVQLGPQFGQPRFEPPFLALEETNAIGELQMPRGNQSRLYHRDCASDASDFRLIGHWLSRSSFCLTGGGMALDCSSLKVAELIRRFIVGQHCGGYNRPRSMKM